MKLHTSTHTHPPLIHKPHTHLISVADLLYLQNYNGTFVRPDMIIRYLFIENYYGVQHNGIDAADMYIRMQDFRRYEGYGQIAADKFVNLIKIFENKGYNPAYPIETDKSLLIRDGSHRTALAVYFNAPFVSVHPSDTPFAFAQKLALFENNGFSDVEKQYISDKYAQLLKKHNYPIKILVWNNNTDYLEKIHHKLNEFGTVTNIEEYSLHNRNTLFLQHCIHMLGDNEFCLNKTKNKEKLTVFNLEINCTEFETVADTRKPVIKQCRYIAEFFNSLSLDTKLPVNFFVPCNFGVNQRITNVMSKIKHTDNPQFIYL